MRVINLLPVLVECLDRWEAPPTEAQFEKEYVTHVGEWLSPMLSDFSGRMGFPFYSMIEELDWPVYRAKTRLLDPNREQARLEKQMAGVETCLGTKLEGEAVLFGAFTMMDGYARFDLEGHRVFLGVDESFEQGNYLDVLISHELTHVIRETRPSVWEGWGISPKMTHDQFTEVQPVIEHVFSEGFSCAISEILNPTASPWSICYQTKESLELIRRGGASIDAAVHAEIRHADGDYSRLYDVEEYAKITGATPGDAFAPPRYAHYAWAWQWVKQLLREENAADPAAAARVLVNRCSKELVEHALHYRLKFSAAS